MLTSLFVDPSVAPPSWRVPGWPAVRPPPSSDDLLHQAKALEDTPPTTVHLVGGEPQRHPDLHRALSVLTDAGHRACVHSALPTLEDDLNVRPFSGHDVFFRVAVPSARPGEVERWRADGGSWEQLAFALRNLTAFAFRVELRVLVTSHTVHALADTLDALHRGWPGTPLHLEVLHGEVPGASWKDVPPWPAVGAQLLQLQTRDLRLPPRVHLHGMPALALPVDELVGVDLRVADTADAGLQVPEGYRAVHGDPEIDSEAVARRRVWLVTPPQDRDSWRGHPLDRFDHTISNVLVRPGASVFALVERRRPGTPYLAQNAAFGVAVAGRFSDPDLKHRFQVICREVYASAKAHPPEDLARLRAIAHVLRRSMKPIYDGNPARALEENHAS